MMTASKDRVQRWKNDFKVDESVAKALMLIMMSEQDVSFRQSGDLSELFELKAAYEQSVNDDKSDS